MSVDVRTRVDGALSFDGVDRFFAHDLPAALEASAELVGPAVEALDLRPLVIHVDGTGIDSAGIDSAGIDSAGIDSAGIDSAGIDDATWTLEARGSQCLVARGDKGGDGALRLRLDAAQLSDLVLDQATPMGWFSSGALSLQGRLERLLDWWLVLRGALDVQAPHVSGNLEFVDRTGSPLDLTRTFSWSDDDGEMAWFLEQTGFLHVGSVFDDDEMAAVAADMDRVAPSYREGDGRSWWARTADGTDRLVRMQGFDTKSARAADLVHDGRLARLGQLTGDGHEWGSMDGNALEALVKPIGVVEGISDVPWHKDCALGRHSYECCSLTVGISVTGADATSGQLRVVAGSNRVLVWPAFVRHGNELPVVDLPTRTGDVTVHLSCTLHMAQPPLERERKVMYTGFRLPPLAHEAAARARQRLRTVRETAATTVSQPPSRVVG
jgi:hypothetical protein